MSRVFFARNIQYYKAKIARENRQLEDLQEALTTEQLNQGNKQRINNFLKSANQWAINQMLGLGNNMFNGSLWNIGGMNNNFMNLMNGSMSAYGGGNTGLYNSVLGSYTGGYGGNGFFGGIGNLLGNMGNGLMNGVGGFLGGLGQLCGLSPNFMNDLYSALPINNEYNDMYNDGFLSDMKTNDIEQQITMLNSQIKADTKQLENLEKAEDKAIERGMGKFA